MSSRSDSGSAPFRGVGVALVTLFGPDGELDAAGTARLAEWLVEAGMQAIVVGGSTGEAAALDFDERLVLLDAVRAAVAGRVPVLAGTGAPSARQAARLTEAASDHGADAVLVLSPPGVSDPRAYYEAVAKVAGGVGVLAYHYPSVSAPGIPAEQLAELPVAGCKDSSGDVDRFLFTLASPWQGALYTGAAPLVPLAGSWGAAGAILALANAEPERCLAAYRGEPAAMLELAAAHRTARRSFPGGIKELTATRWGTSAVARLG